MRYNLERGGGIEKIELPEGHTFKMLPQHAKTPDGETVLFWLEFFDPENNPVGVFANVGAFYPASFIPPKQEFVNSLPEDLAWVAPKN